ncbi:metal ABC transporter solute-binding protein, Zn/Mn family [Metabacillus herbersteinensis]|uniref:Metal ABC transporter solute-binding protein, Zn/Mn family n=1 Tax=Metabacillus herbersteinensis TaxID=283816 RepID=A0ABV6GJY9_9BACI
MKKISLLFAIILVFSTVLIGCASNEKTEENTNQTTTEEPSTEKLKVFTTIFPIEDFTKKIGGDVVEVESVYPAGADAHTFEPTSKTMVEIAEADAFIYSGVGLEGFTEKAEETLKDEDVTFVVAGKGIELLSADGHDKGAHDEEAHDEGAHDEEAHDEEAHDEEAHDEEGHDEEGHAEHGDTDPHIWLDPILSIQLAENIKNALVELNPDEKETFEKNFESLKSDLESLDQQFKEVTESADKKEILVSHAAYGYWETRYGIELISVLGLSPTQEPSQKELQIIVEEAKEHDIKYVIFESNVSSNISDIVQNEIGAESLTLRNLESITEEDKTNKEDYFSLMEKNLETLKKALTN